jgi:hypothetical protein
MPLYPLYPSKHGGMTISCEMWAAIATIATNKYVVWKLSVIPDTVFGTCIPTTHCPWAASSAEKVQNIKM